MVPRAVSGAGAPAHGALPEVSGPAADHDAAGNNAVGGVDEPVLRIDRVGPGGGVPSDSAFGVALVSLWQRTIEAGGLVGFAPPVVRPEVAARAAGLVDEIRTGRVIAVVANKSHRLVGAALLRPGRGTAAHTGHLELVLVDPAQARSGIGSGLMADLLGLARDRGLERVDLDAPDDTGLGAFFGRFGFTVLGRRPGWIRTGSDDVRDEIVWGVTV